MAALWILSAFTTIVCVVNMFFFFREREMTCVGTQIALTPTYTCRRIRRERDTARDAEAECAAVILYRCIASRLCVNDEPLSDPYYIQALWKSGRNANDGRCARCCMLNTTKYRDWKTRERRCGLSPNIDLVLVIFFCCSFRRSFNSMDLFRSN